jgi:hypothetical protein
MQYISKLPRVQNTGCVFGLAWGRGHCVDLEPKRSEREREREREPSTRATAAAAPPPCGSRRTPPARGARASARHCPPHEFGVMRSRAVDRATCAHRSTQQLKSASQIYWYGRSGTTRFPRRKLGGQDGAAAPGGAAHVPVSIRPAPFRRCSRPSTNAAACIVQEAAGSRPQSGASQSDRRRKSEECRSTGAAAEGDL